MSDAALTILVELLSAAGLAVLSSGKKAKVRVALSPLAETLEIGLARIPFALTPSEAERFRADLQVLVELLASNSIDPATLNAANLNKLLVQLDQTSQALAQLDHSEAFTVLTAIRNAKLALEH